MNKYTIVKELIDECEFRKEYYDRKVLMAPSKRQGAIMAITGILNKLHKINNELDMELDEMSDYYAKNKLSNGG